VIAAPSQGLTLTIALQRVIDDVRKLDNSAVKHSGAALLE
jgi:hypothetical protein